MRAIISRLNPESPIAPVQYLRRETALFAAEEWSWIEVRVEAWEEELSIVETRAAELREERQWRCWVLIVGDEGAEQARRAKEAGQLPTPREVVMPEPEYETAGRPPRRRIQRIGSRFNALEAERAWQEAHEG